MKVVLPLDNTEVVVVPNAPSMNLPGLPSLPTLGTVAHDVNALSEKNDDAGLQCWLATQNKCNGRAREIRGQWNW